MKYLNVFIQNNISRIDDLYTYMAHDEVDVEVGMRVQVPFGKGNRNKIGIVLSIEREKKSEYKIKEIIEVLDYKPIIDEDLIELGFWMKNKYLTKYNQSFAPLLPPGDIKTIQRIANIKSDYTFLDSEVEFAEELVKNKYNLKFVDSNENFKLIVKKLIREEVLTISFKVDTVGGTKSQKAIKLRKDYLNTMSESKIKLSEKQLIVIEYLQKKGTVLKSELLQNLKISDSPVKTLENKNLIETIDKEIERNPYENVDEFKINVLNEEQVKAFRGILNSNKKVSLLHGLTGSGKTEVYLKLAEEAIRKNEQVIVLVPEIGLTPQMIDRFKGRFGESVSVLHSKLSQGERYDQWQKVKNGEVSVVVGARSAVFAPFDNLKLIIIDEEHDSSYKFHNALRYDTIEVAKKRMEMESGKVVLGSATPDINSYYRAQEGEYDLFELKKRAVIGAKLPNVQIVDMRNELIKGNTSIFSESLRGLISEKLERREQIILFLNRRGFSNFVSCRACGHVIKCDNCDISMTYHKNTNMLRCHYCGSTKKMVTRCPECGSKFIKQFGVGTQKVEEEVKKIFPNAKVLRMDKDTTVKKKSYDEIYKRVKDREVDVLIGTQMLAKGLDFENVTLVGVIAADLSLYISDYRANETTFDLLTQVSGRAGRSSRGGDVVIQSYNPENYSIIYASNADYLNFYKRELEVRREFNYPPFSKLVNIYFSSEDNSKIENLANRVLFEIGREISGFKVEYTRLIQTPRIKNIYKYKFTLKVDPNFIDKLTDIIKGVLIKNRKEINKSNIYVDVEFV
ncbi:replication restart DNA helicase PriA [Anaerosphaera aminiphila DSM 21120]|uniref:Replication restart protein PriA n=1 Tax=Anaerosphaera aminiphila DSM 21120 TaxID=1120995 RepID=A0A1M5SZV3_9FIRM|nr:primosomal protein N' [Anaerosphaera aminiphila]SHH44041.1 replication restart DNA helicase PriA [Anaerosphaera aminiphila DSM 21120]